MGIDAYWMLSASGFALAMSATPGPNNAMVAASGANFGIARTLPHILGVSIGFPVMLAAIAFGAGGLLRLHPGVLTALHWIGAAYLLWLAWRIGAVRPVRSGSSAGAGAPGVRPMRFGEAALFQWANPKAWLIAMSGIAAYAMNGERVAPVQVLVLTVLFLLICIPSTMMWTSIGAGTALLLRTDRQMRLFNLGMALLLVASLAPMLLEP